MTKTLDHEKIDKNEYPYIYNYTEFIHRPSREILGRDKEVKLILATFCRPEISNILLLAEAGVGKTSVVKLARQIDESRVYMEVDLARMLTELNNQNEMASRLKALFDEAERFGKTEGKEMVLFIDEFHQIVQLSSAGVEALKPLLAESGRRGIRVIAATTYEEFNEQVSKNQPLVERFVRINLRQPDKNMTVSILRNIAETYNMQKQFPNDNVFELIYEYTNRYMPSNSQPRKSILLLDALIGWYRSTKAKIDMKLLADVLYDTQGVDVAFKIDATSIEEKINKKVFAQEFAASVLAQRLQLCVADLNDKEKPQSSFLFCGSTGVGKMIADYEKVPIYDKFGKTFFKNHGDLVEGDYVFARDGKPTKVLATFKHKNVDMYKVTLTDGRTLDVGAEHLWSVYSAKQRDNIQNKNKNNIKPMVMSTKDILEKGVFRQYDNGSKHLKWFVPANNAVEWNAKDYDVDPYIVGAFLGNGCMTQNELTFSSNDKETVNRIKELLEAPDVCHKEGNYSWLFLNPYRDAKRKYIYTKEIFGDLEEIYNKYSKDRRIPQEYLCGSIDQRWELVRGLFDTDGVAHDDDRCNISYSTFSKNLAEDLQQLLYSLGFASSINCYKRIRENCNNELRKLAEYVVRVKASREDKLKFFHLSRKKNIIQKWIEKDDRVRVKKFDLIGIKSIDYISKQDAQCILVDNDEHLYQAGDFIVTHNTEVSKVLAGLLFNDSRALIRFDMTEYSQESSLERFREDLTMKVWARPNCIILFDEIEKACGAVTRILLQVLDDGRLSDRNGREVSFINSYIIMTTNAGSEVFKNISNYQSSDFADKSMVDENMALIRRSITETTGANKFPPELLGRIDCIVPFQPLSEKTMNRIVRSKLFELKREVRLKHSVELTLDAKLIDFIVSDNISTDSNAGGARQAIAKLEEEVTTNVAKYINKHPNDRYVGVKVDGVMKNEDKNSRISRATVKVYKIR